MECKRQKNYKTAHKRKKRRITSLVCENNQPKTTGMKNRKTKSDVEWRGLTNKKKEVAIEPFKVFVRIRPLNKKEVASQQEGLRPEVIKKVDNKILLLSANMRYDLHKRYREYVLDDVFSQQDSTSKVFNTAFSNLADNVIKGFNSTIFAYGLTGTGKTYTMFGNIYEYQKNRFNPGIIFLSVQDLLKKIQQYNDRTIKVKLSYLEIYNEQVKDLLCSENINENLVIIEDPEKGIVVPGLKEFDIETVEQIVQYIMKGNERRIMASTYANQFSSRSHAILNVTLDQVVKIPGKPDRRITSKLSMIDLAGSEKDSSHRSCNARKKEGANINKSLLALGNCINILSDQSKKGAFVPYRDSKLTRLLKHSLGGNTITVMIACISPSFLSAEETNNTLKYAQRAKKIKKSISKNTKEGKLSLSQYKSMIESLKSEVTDLKLKLSQKETTQKGQKSEKNFHSISKKLFHNFEEKLELQQTFIELDDLHEENNRTIVDYEEQLKIVGDESPKKNRIMDSIYGLRTIMQNNEDIRKQMITQMNESTTEVIALQTELKILQCNSNDPQQQQIISKILCCNQYDTQTQNVKIKKEAINLVKLAGKERQKMLEMSQMIKKMQEQLQKKDEKIQENQNMIKSLKNKKQEDLADKILDSVPTLKEEEEEETVPSQASSTNPNTASNPKYRKRRKCSRNFKKRKQFVALDITQLKKSAKEFQNIDFSKVERKHNKRSGRNKHFVNKQEADLMETDMSNVTRLTYDQNLFGGQMQQAFFKDISQIEFCPMNQDTDDLEGLLEQRKNTQRMQSQPSQPLRQDLEVNKSQVMFQNINPQYKEVLQMKQEKPTTSNSNQMKELLGLKNKESKADLHEMLKVQGIQELFQSLKPESKQHLMNNHFKQKLHNIGCTAQEGEFDSDLCIDISQLLDDYYKNTYKISYADVAILKRLQELKIQTEKNKENEDKFLNTSIQSTNSKVRNFQEQILTNNENIQQDFHEKKQKYHKLFIRKEKMRYNSEFNQM